MDNAMGQLIAAVPREYLGFGVIVLVMMFGFGRWIVPVRQQLQPAKGSINGSRDTLHVKLDRVIETVDRVDSRVARTETRLDSLEQLVSDVLPPDRRS